MRGFSSVARLFGLLASLADLAPPPPGRMSVVLIETPPPTRAVYDTGSAANQSHISIYTALPPTAYKRHLVLKSDVLFAVTSGGSDAEVQRLLPVTDKAEVKWRTRISVKRPRVVGYNPICFHSAPGSVSITPLFLNP